MVDSEPKRVEFVVDAVAYHRWDLNRKHRDIANMTEFFKKAGDHFVHCSKTAINQHWHWQVLTQDSICCICEDKIPKGTQVWYSEDHGDMCPKCYGARWGDKGRLQKVATELDLKEDVRVLNLELKVLHEKYRETTHEEKLDQVLKNHVETQKAQNEIQKKIDEMVKLELSYFKDGYGTEELKEVLEKLRKQLVMLDEDEERFRQQIEATEPLVRDVADFHERRIKKRNLKEVSAQYP